MRIADNAAGSSQLALWDAASDTPRIRHSVRARRVSIRIHEDASVELVVPRGVSEARARDFLLSRFEWVREQVSRRRAVARPLAPFPPELLELDSVGERWSLFIAGGRGAPRVIEQTGLLSLAGEGTDTQWRRLLRRWLAARARKAFAPRLAELALHHGFHYERLSVRAQRSRWGSCSTRGTISLNLALLFQSPDVLRYLMLHELSHTRHMNHSAAFWRCVAACEPSWRSLDRELVVGWRKVPRWVLAAPEAA